MCRYSRPCITRRRRSGPLRFSTRQYFYPSFPFLILTSSNAVYARRCASTYCSLINLCSSTIQVVALPDRPKFFGAFGGVFAISSIIGTYLSLYGPCAIFLPFTRSPPWRRICRSRLLALVLYVLFVRHLLRFLTASIV